MNTLLKYLRNEEQGLIEAFDYDFKGYLDLAYYEEREKANWMTAKEKLLQKNEQENEDNDDDDDDDD